MTAIDHTTKWPMARAMKEATSAEVVKFIYEEIMLRFGCPVEILTDRGRNFLSETVEGYLATQRVKHLKTSAYHPRSNGAVERFNGLFGRMLSRYVANNVTAWDLFIDQALFACRVRKHKATDRSPFFMVYGKEAVLPGDPTRPLMQLDPNDQASFESRVDELIQLGNEREEAMQKVIHERELLSKRREEEIEYFSFYPGDLVMLQVMTPKKLEANFDGPYAVIRKAPLGTYKLLHPNGMEKLDLVNVQRLKLARLSDEQFQQIFSDKAKEILHSAIKAFEEEEDVTLKVNGMLGLVFRIEHPNEDNQLLVDCQGNTPSQLGARKLLGDATPKQAIKGEHSCE